MLNKIKNGPLERRVQLCAFDRLAVHEIICHLLILRQLENYGCWMNDSYILLCINAGYWFIFSLITTSAKYTVSFPFLSRHRELDSYFLRIILLVHYNKNKFLFLFVHFSISRKDKLFFLVLPLTLTIHFQIILQVR